MGDYRTELDRAQQQHKRVVMWGCDIHHTPRGEECPKAAPTKANSSAGTTSTPTAQPGFRRNTAPRNADQ